MLRDSGFRVAFFGAMSPLAHEVRKHLAEMAFPIRSLHLYDVGEQEGTVTEYDGEAMLVTQPDEDLEVDIAYICGEDDPRSPEYLDWAGRTGGVTLDLVGASRSRADVPVVHFAVGLDAIRTGCPVLAAPHPIAHPLLTTLHLLGLEFPVREASATILRPVSDFGEAGIEELQRQTVALLSFSEVPKEVFGRQVAFNLFPVSIHGEEGGALDAAVRGDVLRVLPSPLSRLDVRILQAPIFYGHSYSMRVVLDGAPGAEALAEALERPGVVRISGEEGGRTPAELADESGIWIGEIAPDPAGTGAYWIWAVSDAIRSGAALNGAHMAARLAEILG